MNGRIQWISLLLVLSLGVGTSMGANPFGDKLISGLNKAGKTLKKDKSDSKDTEAAKEESANEKVAAGPKVPIVLDKWGRYHTNITTFEKPAKKADGTTDYQKFCWVPKVEVVIQLVNPENDDVVILQHYRGKEKWGDPIKVTPFNIIKRDKKDYSLVLARHTMDEANAISDTGAFSVNVSYKQTGRGKLHENLATFTYTVKNCTRNWTSQGKVPGFYVDHDFRMGEAWLYRTSDGKIELWTWFKYDREGEAKVRDGRVRCYHGDKMFKFTDNPTRRTEISYQDYPVKTKNTQITWGLWYWWIPRIDGIMAGDYLKKYPGKFRCVLTQDGEISREFHFTVGDDGEIVRVPFEGAKTIFAVEDSFPLKMEFKKNPDLKFDPTAFKTSAFYSRK